MRVALVHDYLMQGVRGAERVLAAIHELYPQAPVYTLLYDADLMRPLCAEWQVRSSFLQKLPAAKRLHRRLLPLMPRATESFPLQEYDLVLSSSSAWAKSVRFRPDATHVCYCHSPARFLWFWSEQYVETATRNGVTRAALRRMIARLRRWDAATCGRPSAYLANSRLVQGRIREYFGRESTVVYPPVDTEFFVPGGEADEYFLVVSALNPYKRVDLAVEAFNRLGLPLVVIGEGPERERLEALARPNVRLLGRRETEEVRWHLQRCRAFVMPQEEDFGIAPVEAMACGRPVLAYGAGGALETVVAEETGLFFAEQTPEALVAAVRSFEERSFSAEACRSRAEEFSKARFQAEYQAEVERALNGRR